MSANNCLDSGDSSSKMDLRDILLLPLPFPLTAASVPFIVPVAAVVLLALSSPKFWSCAFIPLLPDMTFANALGVVDAEIFLHGVAERDADPKLSRVRMRFGDA